MHLDLLVDFVGTISIYIFDRGVHLASSREHRLLAVNDSHTKLYAEVELTLCLLKSWALLPLLPLSYRRLRALNASSALRLFCRGSFATGVELNYRT